MEKNHSGLPPKIQEGTPQEQMMAILNSGHPNKLFDIESYSLLLRKLKASEIVDGLLKTENVFDLLRNMTKIREQGPVDSNDLVKKILIIDNGAHIEYLVRNLESGQFGKLSEETYALLDQAISRSTAREMIEGVMSKYKVSHENDEQ